MIGTDEVILCANKAKNVAIAIATMRLFNEISVQKNQSDRLGYFITIPKSNMNIIMKNVFILIAIIFFIDCGAQKKPPKSGAVEPIETAYDTIKIVNEEIEYEIIILELGFDTWLVSQPPMSYYTSSTLAIRNYMMVVEWNIRVQQPLRYDPTLYGLEIDYQPNIDYGIEVNYLLYMYFKYFQQKYQQRLGPYQP